MTRVGQVLLVLSITDQSGTAIGVLSAFQFGPVLLLGPWAGVVADRRNVHTLLLTLQIFSGLTSLTMGALVAFDLTPLAAIFLLSAGQGVITAFDNPTRRAFLSELVPPEGLPNAISLNSAAVTSARTFGPALAGLVVATAGYAWCFFIDGISYLAVVAGLLAMRRGELRRSPRAVRRWGQVTEGLRYIRRNPALAVPLVMMALVCTLAWNFTVSIPLLVTDSLDGTETQFTWLLSSLSFGSVVGALISARRTVVSLQQLVLAAAVFGAGMTGLAATPNLAFAFPSAILVGLASVYFMTTAATTLQLISLPALRGRVTAIQSMVFLGSTPIGSPIVGVVADLVNPRAAVALGAIGCAAATVYGAQAGRRNPGLSGPALAPDVQ